MSDDTKYRLIILLMRTRLNQLLTVDRFVCFCSKSVASIPIWTLKVIFQTQTSENSFTNINNLINDSFWIGQKNNLSKLWKIFITHKLSSSCFSKIFLCSRTNVICNEVDRKIIRHRSFLSGRQMWTIDNLASCCMVLAPKISGK